MNSNLPQKQFSLNRVFLLLAVLAVIFALVAYCARPVPGRVPEATLLQSVDAVTPGIGQDEVTRIFGFRPSASWLDTRQCGYVCWRFEVTDVAYADCRASYFAKMEDGKLDSGFLLYPIESAGGGMRF